MADACLATRSLLESTGCTSACRFHHRTHLTGHHNRGKQDRFNKVPHAVAAM